MSGGRIVVDGLWRCLCPSFDEALLSRAARHTLRTSTPRRPALSRPSNICTTQWQHQQTRRITNPAVANTQASLHTNQDDLLTITKVILPDNTDSPLPEPDGTTTAEMLLKLPYRPILHNAATPVIYEVLRTLQSRRKGSRGKLRAFVKYLVEKRDQKPNAFLYEALIASNCDPAGSAKEVRDILNEMKRLGIEATAGLYRVALKALAVHPDYLLRSRVLGEMKERWMDLGVEGRCAVALGLLREGQVELAMEKLEGMVEEKVEVPGWVFDVFVVVLAQLGAVEDAVGLVQRRMGIFNEEGGMDGVGMNIWYLLLEEASRRFHYEGARWVWDQMVATGTIVPSDGTCLHVLNTASRYGDAVLATEVIGMLSARNVKLGIHHYEALVDCYANRDDIEHAVRTLCIMANAGVMPDNSSTRFIYMAFKRVPALVDVAVDVLLRLRATHVIPLPALNVVIQGLCLVNDHSGALDLYMQVRSLCACNPEAYTYGTLLETASDPKIAQFLVAEMLAFGLQSTREQNDKVVALLLAEDDFDGVFEYLATISAYPGMTKDVWITSEKAIALVKKCFAKRDERVWALLDTAKGLGMDLGEVTNWLAEDGIKEPEPGAENGAHRLSSLVDTADTTWTTIEKASEAGSG